MEPVFHVVIPALLLMVIFPKWNKKLIVLMAIAMEFLIDVDNFFPGWHRILTHNIFWILVLTFLFYLWKREAGFMALYFGLSHLIFDLRHFGVAFLWPFVNRLFAFDINASPANDYFFSFKFNLFRFEELRAVEYVDYYVTQWGVSLLAFILLSYLIWKILEKKSKVLQ